MIQNIENQIINHESFIEKESNTFQFLPYQCLDEESNLLQLNQKVHNSIGEKFDAIEIFHVSINADFLLNSLINQQSLIELKLVNMNIMMKEANIILNSQSLRQLRWLNLSLNPFGPSIFKCIIQASLQNGNFQFLQQLDLYNCQLGLNQKILLSEKEINLKFKNLKIINLSHNLQILENIEQKSFMSPFMTDCLEELYFEGCGINSSKEIIQLSSSNITKLDLRSNQWQEDVISVFEKILKKFNKLETLLMEQPSKFKIVFEPLIENLIELDFKLKHNFLKRLNLSNNLNKKQIEEFISKFVNNYEMPVLELLILDKNNLKNAHLFQLLTSNNSLNLKFLSAKKNKIQNINIYQSNLSQIFNPLKQKTNLQILDISENFECDNHEGIPLNKNAKKFLNNTVIIAIPKQKKSSKNVHNEELDEDICELSSLQNAQKDQTNFGNLDPNPLHIYKPFQFQLKYLQSYNY